MTTQASFPKKHVYRPHITFEDTNIVGNVYFANFVRWQDECRDGWLRRAAPDLYDELFGGAKRFFVSNLKLDFYDPAGVSVGDEVEVESDIDWLHSHAFRVATSMRRTRDACSTSEAPPLAIGEQCFDIVDGLADFAPCGCPPEEPCGPAFQIDIPVSLKTCRPPGRLDVLQMIRWQGKCRERFLSENAPATLRFVAAGAMVLHTSRVRLELLRDLAIKPTDSLRVEMRLTHLKGGRLTVQFDYYAAGGASGALAGRRIATGSQSLCCKRPFEHGLSPAVFPVDMLQALRRFTDSADLQSNIDDSLDFAGSDAEWKCPGARNGSRPETLPFSTDAFDLVPQVKE